MKIFSTLIAVLAFSVAAFAQLPAGSESPNFISKDLNGKSWDLYEVLATGRPVIMDVSATWCGPCWSYHQSGALETVYEQHGPEGDGTLMVFWVEGDGATNTACIYGPSGCNNSTQGNWTTGTPFPMFDDATVNSKFDISYFPTIYLIAPDKKIKEVGQVNATSLWNQASAVVGNVPTNFAKALRLDPKSTSGQICQPQSATPSFTLENFGSAALTYADLELTWNGQVLQSKAWTGHLAAFEDEKVTFDAVTITGAGTLAVNLKNPNGDASVAVSSTSFDFIDAPQVFSTQTIVFQLRTDNNGKDIWWGIYDEANNLLAKGGNEQVGPNGGGQFPGGAPADPTAYGNYSTKTTNVTLPASGCFTLKIVDAVGNGMVAPGSYKIFNSTDLTTPVFQKIGFAGAYEKRTFAPKTDFTGTNDPNTVESFSIFPNPVSEKLTVDLTISEKSDVAVFVTNAVGQVVRSENYILPVGGSQVEVPVADLANGFYFLNVRAENGSVQAKKFTVAK